MLKPRFNHFKPSVIIAMLHLKPLFSQPCTQPYLIIKPSRPIIMPPLLHLIHPANHCHRINGESNFFKNGLFQDKFHIGLK